MVAPSFSLFFLFFLIFYISFLFSFGNDLHLYQVGLDEVVQGLNNLPTAKYWGMRLSNIPHPSDVCPTTIGE